MPLDAQRVVNLYPVVDEQGSAPSALYGTPGLQLFGVAGIGAVRGGFAASNDRCFFVSGAFLYEIDSAGITTERGALSTSGGIVTMEENGFQLGICDGESVYMFTFLTNAFAKVTDPDLPSVGGIDFIDGYFVVNQNNSGKFFISGLYDGLTWSALDFATAESSPDKLVRAANFVGQLGLFGSKTLEIWRNTGDSVFPFSRISGAAPIGCAAPYTVVSLDTSVYWVGANDQGTGVVYTAKGFSPTKISTPYIERTLQAVTDLTMLRAWSYQQDGKVFYCITGGSLETTLVYELGTQVWHERAYLAESGAYEQHLGTCCVYAFGKHLVGDRNNGNIYELKQDVYSDNGNPIKRVRVFTHLVDELKRIRYNTLTLLVETGVGLQEGQGSDPVISLRMSKDGGRTFGDYYSTTIGAVGKYQTEVNFRRLGIAQTMTFEVSISDPVKVSLIGAYLE